MKAVSPSSIALLRTPRWRVRTGLPICLGLLLALPLVLAWPAPSASAKGHSTSRKRGAVGKKAAAHSAPKQHAKGAAQAATPDLHRTWLTAEDLRLGDFHAPPAPYPFPLLGDEKAKEVFVDKAGRLYKERKYSGVVPDWRKRAGLRRGRCRVREQTVTWVGFQNTFDSSRVFVQLEGEACGYVYRPDERHIVIDLPAVRVENPNWRRDILTGAFPTPVSLVHVETMGNRGTRITIALKEPRRYLSAHLGRYVFVDVAR